MDIPDSAPAGLSIRKLTKIYHARRSFLSFQPVEVRGLDEVHLELEAGSTLAILGRSGSGKSTLARCVAGLEAPTSGQIWFAGNNLGLADVAHRHVQLVFQDPGSSLNPRFTVTQALTEPLVAGRAADCPTGYGVAERLEQVGLPPALAQRSTSQLSGGQKLRLAVARAIVALGDSRAPGILILDESLGGLDLCVRAQMINLLVDLQEQRGLTYILITHDESLAWHMADQVAVMAHGKVVKCESYAGRSGASEHA